MIEKIGEIIKYHRKKSGLGRDELAKLAGVGKTVVYDLEHGKETIRLATLKKVSTALGITITLESKLMKSYTEEQNAKG